MTVQISPVRNQRERETFLRFPWKLYRGDPLWVPPFLPERRARLDPATSSILQAGGQLAAWVARHKGQVVGTIAGAVDGDANAHSGKKEAVFGFFECINDYAVAQTLLTTVADWARELGMTTLVGPRNFGANDEPGLLIEGREFPPVMLMAHTMVYYPDLVERFGFKKSGDVYAYRLLTADFDSKSGGFPPKLLRVVEAVRQRTGVKVRKASLSRWEKEAETARRLYNEALKHLPDHVPMSPEEWSRFAEGVRPLLDEDLILFAEVDDEPVGWALALPDVNQAFMHAGGGRYPWHFIKLWWYSRHIKVASFKIVAMLEAYRGRGLDALLYYELGQALLAKGYQWVDASLVSEHNPMMNRIVERMGGKRYKQYRVYQLVLHQQDDSDVRVQASTEA